MVWEGWQLWFDCLLLVDSCLSTLSKLHESLSLRCWCHIHILAANTFTYAWARDLGLKVKHTDYMMTKFCSKISKIYKVSLSLRCMYSTEKYEPLTSLSWITRWHLGVSCLKRDSKVIFLYNVILKRPYLIAFTIVFQASRPLTVAPLIVSSFIVTSTFANLWPESLGVSIQTSLYCLLSVLFMG